MSELVAILDENGNNLFDTAVNIGVSVSPSKTFARHSLENRQVIVDDQYDNPTSITMRIVLDPSDYVNVYKEIKSAYESITNFTIQTRVDSHPNMFLESLPHEEDPSIFNTISMSLDFTEQLISAPGAEFLSADEVSNKSDADTTNSGQKSTSDDDGTLLQRLNRRLFG